MKKKCTRCKKSYLIEQFYNSSSFKGGKYPQCRKCHRDAALIRAYGIDAAEYELMKGIQNNLCAICGKSPSSKGLFVDHSHSTGRVRELLCTNCNTALGLVKENKGTLVSMLAYLEKHESLL